MSWWAVGAAAVSMVSSASQQAGSAKSMSKQVVAQNEAIIKANVQNTVRTGYRVGLLNVQRGISKRIAQQKGFDTTKMASQALGAVTANQAASGTIGASTEAVANDVRMKLGEAQAQQREDFEISGENFNAQLREIVNQGQAAIESPYKANVASGGQIAGNALLSGAITFGSMYAQGKMDLGLGTTSGTGTSGPSAAAGGGSWGGDTSGFKLGT